MLNFLFHQQDDKGLTKGRIVHPWRSPAECYNQFAKRPSVSGFYEQLSSNKKGQPLELGVAL